MKNKGLLIVLSAPSGCGKDTILEALFKHDCSCTRSVSVTTRLPRSGETDGVDYFFVSEERFKEMINENALLEYAQYGTNFYGTPKAAVDKWLEEGKNVILKIETQGADKVREMYPDSVGIFIIPPSLNVLENRLRSRGTETEDDIRIRLDIAKNEMKKTDCYDYVVVNDEIDKAVNNVLSIITAETMKTENMKEYVNEVLQDVES